MMCKKKSKESLSFVLLFVVVHDRLENAGELPTKERKKGRGAQSEKLRERKLWYNKKALTHNYLCWDPDVF